MEPLTSNAPPSRRAARGLSRAGLAVLTGTTCLMAGCLATSPSMGDNKGVVSGAAGGQTSAGDSGRLERCAEALGTVALDEDQSAPWYAQLRQNSLTSTVPVLRLMIQQSNCFVIVERGRAMNNLMRERDLARSAESRAGSNFGQGQLVAADYTVSPEVQFAGKTGGGSAALGTLRLPGINLGTVSGTLARNEASATLLLIDNRSGVQIAAAEGTAQNFDFGLLGAGWTSGTSAGVGSYASTPQGRVVTAAFADSFNQMVRALRNYRQQTVRGGLGTGGHLGVQGGPTGGR